MRGAAGRGDLAEWHHRGRDEARGEVGRVGGQEEGALLGWAAGRGGSGRGRTGAAADTAVREGTDWGTEGRAGVMRGRSSWWTCSSSPSRWRRAESLWRALRSTAVTLGRGGKRALLLGTTGVSIQQRRDFLNREPLKSRVQKLLAKSIMTITTNRKLDFCFNTL